MWPRNIRLSYCYGGPQERKWLVQCLEWNSHLTFNVCLSSILSKPAWPRHIAVTVSYSQEMDPVGQLDLCLIGCPGLTMLERTNCHAPLAGPRLIWRKVSSSKWLCSKAKNRLSSPIYLYTSDWWEVTLQLLIQQSLLLLLKMYWLLFYCPSAPACPY